MAATDYQASIDNGTDNVDILINFIDHDFDKQLVVVSIPKENPPKVLLIDIKRLKEVITLTGWLEDTDAISALTKKKTLRTILQTAGTMTLAWGIPSSVKEQSYTVNILKCKIGEKPYRVGEEGNQDKAFEIKIQFILGTHKG